MKRNLFRLLIMLVAFIGVKDVKALTLDDTIYCQNGWPVADYFYSIKQNKTYPITCSSGAASITVYDAIKNNLLEGELDNIEDFSIFTWGYDSNSSGFNYLTPVPSDANVLIHDPWADNPSLSSGAIIEKGTILVAPYIVVNGNTQRIFYADMDYVISSAYGSYYDTYYTLEALNQPEENYKLDLKCLSDKDGSHYYELYYNGANSENNESEFEVKFRIQTKNVNGTININNKDLELESNKDYLVNGQCNDADCNVLLAKFNMKDVNENSSSSITIEQVSLSINGEDKQINIENSKCEYSNVIKNPKTSTSIFLLAAIIFIAFGGLLIVLRKKDILTRV